MGVVRAIGVAIAIGFGVLVLLVVGLFAVDSFWPELIWGAPPPILADQNFASDKDGRIAGVFDRRIRQQFPPGTPEKVLRQQLQAWCFRQRPKIGGDLAYSWGALPCSNVTQVTWTADREHRILAVNGMYYYVCI
jgi:hypothetical protein